VIDMQRQDIQRHRLVRDEDRPMPLRVLIAGGGIAAAETVIALRALAGDAVSITMLSPNDELTYRPLSVTAPFGGDTPSSRPLAELAADFGVELVRASLAWVAPSAHTAYADGSTRIDYDVLVVATGARRIPAYEHALTFRGYEDSAEMRDLVQDVETGAARRVAFVVPAGAAWSLPLYELALMTAARAADRGRPVELEVVSHEERPLEVFGPEASAEVTALLDAAGVGWQRAERIDVPRPGRVRLKPGARGLDVDRIVSLPAMRGPAIKGLPADEDGFLRVTPFGHLIGTKDVYAAGDGTSFPIKQGGVACQQADVVAQAIARRAGAPVTPTGYRPVLRGTLLTGARPRWLRSEPVRDGRAATGSEVADHVLWWPPGKVAGHYLAPYLGELGSTEQPPIKGRTVITRGRDRGEVALIALG
jgi:sulfide:quinone oxidoreductase